MDDVPSQNPAQSLTVDGRSPSVDRIIAVSTILLPLAGFLAAIALSWNQGWVFTIDLALLATMYGLSTIGITAGFHRLFAHRSFKAQPWLRNLLGIAGSMAAQGPLFYWVATHREHHQHSDRPGDPHSPHQIGSRRLGTWRGLWHAHIAWMIQPHQSNWSRLVPDLIKDRRLWRIHLNYLLWLCVGLLGPGLIGATIGGWQGFIRGVLWGGFARIFLVHHVTWSVNSICHLFGTRRFGTNDQSQNNLLVGWLALGEGFHNNHHAFPQSARQGWRWYELDLTFWLIHLLSQFGWAYDLQLPAAQQLDRPQVKTRS
jgi:stearoyl-CoA desaturase (Delta-9 desaturase)